MRHRLFATALVTAAAAAAPASADIILSEILGSTSGTDGEFIELVNTGAAPVDISGYRIELWDSDFGTAGFGGADGGSAYILPMGVMLAPGAVYTLANDTSRLGTYFGNAWVRDQLLQENAVENGSYTAILTDSASNVVDSAFVTDGGAGDIANRAGVPFAAALTVGPDGTFLPPGFARTDAMGGFAILDFDTFFGPPSPGYVVGTPGVNQLIPAPGAAALLGLAGFAATRRRRA